MKITKWKDSEKVWFTDKELEEADKDVEAEIRKINVRKIREALKLSQLEVADKTGSTQSQISRLESRDDHKFSSINKLVTALGGELKIIAEFGDTTVRLFGLDLD